MEPNPDGDRLPQAARRRYLTLLFADLSDSTSLAGAIEPEHYLEVLDHLKRCACGIVPRHGGTVVDFRGDGFLAMFGYPNVAEDDGRRATEAALELHETISHGAGQLAGRGVPPLNLHTGIHAGLVLLIENGPGQFLLVGKAPSIAARLSDVAARNEILVSATTLGTERHFFETVDRGGLRLAGEPEPVATWQVLRRSNVATRFEARTRRGWTPFVGRKNALARLQSALRDAASGRLRTASIVAAPGLGKTRLAEEFLLRVPPTTAQVYRGYCESLPAAEPLQPFLQIVRGLARGNDVQNAGDSVSDSDAEIASHVRDVLAVTGSVPADVAGRRPPADGAAGLLAELFELLQRRRPVVVLIDDWHWADEAARRVVAALRERQHLRLLLVTTARSLHPAEGGPAADGEMIELAPLDDDDSVGAIRALRPDADPFAIRRIQELAGGNPLFIEELCHGVGDERRFIQAGSAGESFAWLSTLIDSRVSRLPRRQAELIRTAAIVGTVVPVTWLESIVGPGDREEDVRELAANDLLYPAEQPGALRFKHRLTRDVVYNSIGIDERQRTHLRLAEFLDSESGGVQDELLETLAYHYQAGGRPIKAAQYAELAGHKAMAALALDRARTQYRAALAALDQLPPDDETYQRWMSIAHHLGLACVYDPTRDQLGVFHRAVALAESHGDAAAQARAEYWLAYITYALGDVRAAIDRCERALDVCRAALPADQGVTPEGDLHALMLQVMATLGQAHSAACEHDLALAELDQVLEARRRHKGGRLAAGSAYSLACKGASLGDRGRFAEAHACLNEALASVAGGDHAVKGSVLNWQAGVYLWQGRWQEALAIGTEAAAIAERIESLYVLGMARAIAAYARWRIDGDPQEIDALARATAWLEARDKRLFISINDSWLADASEEAGRAADVRHYAARAIRRGRDGDRFGAAQAYRALARLAAKESRWNRADACLARALTSAERRGAPHEVASVQLTRGHLARARGSAAEAAALITSAKASFQAMDMRWHSEVADRLLTMI